VKLAERWCGQTNFVKAPPVPSPLGEGVRTLLGLPKSIEELFGKRKNNEAIMAI
jgi:hypothetical protein